MNVDSSQPHSPAVSLETSLKVSNVDVTSKIPSCIRDRLDLLFLMSDTVLLPSESNFAEVFQIFKLDPIDYQKCKLTYIEAYIHGFNEKEKNYFLSQFTHKFDPKKEILEIDDLSLKEKDQLWENIICHISETYMGFPIPPLSLQNLFKTHISEKKLAEKFDEGMDILLSFASKKNNRFAQKFLFVTFLGRLISNLEEIENGDVSYTDLLPIEDLFEELYDILLNFPYPLGIENSSKTLLSIMKEDSAHLNTHTLQESFVTQLIDLISCKRTLPSRQIETLKAILRQSKFLKFN